MRGADERLILSNRRRARFTGELWLRMDGQREAGSWPVVGATPLRGQACGNLGCIFRIRDTTLAVITNPLALEEDCRRADTVIAARLSLPRRCEEAGPNNVIARYHLWRRAGHAIRIGEEGIHLETVEDLRGTRPWTSPRNAGQ